MASILDVLNLNLNLGNAQVVDEMTVVPLLGGDLGQVADPEQLQFERTTSYGSMRFRNDSSERPAIVPSNYMVRGQGAQDHAMSSAAVVSVKDVKTFNDACCIEESQGGYLSSSNNEVDILPVLLRKKLLSSNIRTKNDYGKLWPSIGQWLKGLNLQRSGSSHLRYFYDDPNIKPQLEDFSAEFEPVDDQIGAIILFSGIPVGFEIMPTGLHWNAYWKHLVRGCYGAELLRLKMLNLLPPSKVALPQLQSGSSPDQLKEAISEFTDGMRKSISPLLNAIQVTSGNISTAQRITKSLLKTNTGGGGDVIVQNTSPIYASIVL